MNSLTQILSDIFGQAFEALGLERSFGHVRVSDRPDLCQFQCNGAMAAAKQAKANPREIAGKVVEALQAQDDVFELLELAGPGFINVSLKRSFVSKFLAENIQLSPAVDNGQTIVLDYGGPNVAKPMHVGHLRSCIIGDALRRMCLFAGYKAIGDVHMGDWGLPMGQVISELELRHPAWSYFDEGFEGDYPAESPITMADLEEIYPAASGACKADEARLDLARKATASLQDGRQGYRALWQHFIDVSISGMRSNFDALGVHFDLWQGEAVVHDLIAPMVEELQNKKLAVKSDGAVVVHVAQENDKKEVPPLILLKSDGAVMYGTTDLATIVARMADYVPARIVYVVDQRQSLHFEQVFRAARLSEIAPEGSVVLTHAGFGTMNGPDGKPFKTRAGGVMRLEDLIAMGVEKAQARLGEVNLPEDMGDEERADVAHKVAIAAIKFADLQNSRVADYVFDLDRMTQFEGKTGPYLLYQAVRIRSLLARAGGADEGAEIVLGDGDMGLALMLSAFQDRFAAAFDGYLPHILCEHLYGLAQAFSSFYGRCHIMSETDEVLRASRLRLCSAVLHHLEVGLGLLGITIPDRM